MAKQHRLFIEGTVGQFVEKMESDYLETLSEDLNNSILYEIDPKEQVFNVHFPDDLNVVFTFEEIYRYIIAVIQKKCPNCGNELILTFLGKDRKKISLYCISCSSDFYIMEEKIISREVT